MADEDHASHEGDDDYVSARQRRYQRFIELGGDTTIDADLRALGRKPTLEDYVTPRHKDLVMDLVAAGTSHEAIAIMFGIAKDTLQTLFKFELSVGYEIKQAGLARALYTSGMSGDTQAAVNWLRLNPRGQWASKSELSEKGAEQTSEATQAQVKANQEWAQAMISGMLTDQKLKRPPKKVDGPKIVGEDAKAKKRSVEYKSRIKKAKGD